ncbi:MAG: integrase [delta proteobacterium ML8_D]|nr:MAG: integrase [Firmicutes bacterium ML8_F2]OPL15105.1 MAG: integrase [delta proteobacterium ML8_D]
MQAQVINFPTNPQPVTKARKVTKAPDIHYFNKKQVQLIRRTVRDSAVLDSQKGKVTAIREWAIIDTLTSTGIRVGECANIRCSDIKTGYGQSELFIRNGKGSKSRTVQLPESLKTHLNNYLKWKTSRKEAVGPDDYLFQGQRGPVTSQGIQLVVKKYLKQLGLYEEGKSAHSLRHSYATQYYHNTKDLRGLQKQLGHSSIQTTQIYADVTKEDIQQNLKGLWS